MMPYTVSGVNNPQLFELVSRMYILFLHYLIMSFLNISYVFIIFWDVTLYSSSCLTDRDFYFERRLD